MKERMKIALAAAGCTASAVVIGLAVTGRQTGWGPFGFLFKGFEDEVRAIEEKYDAQTRKKEIVFYGASNF
ncbi:MAG: hypothetical protein IJ091_05540 [Oscillospiraceae bacterium]|nr:hypothetical protein [Oscillospiraceae bacterium]